MDRFVKITSKTFDRIRKTVHKDERHSSYVDTKTPAELVARGLWLKIKSKAESSWSPCEYVYTCDVFMSPFEETAFSTDQKAVNSLERNGVDSNEGLALNSFIKAVDFLNFQDQWYYVVTAAPRFPRGQYQFMDYTTKTQDQWGFDYDRGHAMFEP